MLMENLLKLQTLEFGEIQDDKAAKAIVELRGKIPAPILDHYDRLRVRGKQGLAAVRHQVCTACHMRVPLGTIMTIKHGQDIQLCDNCGRYLYLPPGEESAPVPAPAAIKRVRAPRRPKKPSAPA